MYTNAISNPNHYYINLSEVKIDQFYKTNYSCAYLDMSNNDLYNNNFFFLLKSFKNSSKYILFWLESKSQFIFSSTGSVTWSSREVTELFNTNIVNLTDTRNLLLDYSINQHPLNKSFPTQGLQEVYFNFYSQQTDYITLNTIEL